ncbi:hypothetical protein [Roseibium aggregatum]|uniref:Uncharacterized protein n=1 Tax=Roseibium aggregatum TaxID=187304 RepID=A0A0M6Y8T2_9HYPH|nr:hypothetical protein [Roseibium aggregatum]CTQ45677.1 hypothetical protein LAL4801_04132 [Roseibium aggregatum]
MSTNTGCESQPVPELELMLPGLGEEIRKLDAKISTEKFEKEVGDRVKQIREEFGGPENISVEDAVTLFQAVLTRAYKDAICLDMLICNDEDGEDEAKTQERALSWFLKRSVDFENVCRLAGFDPDKVFALSVAEFVNRGTVYLTNKGNYRIDFDELGKPHRREGEILH